MHTDFGLDITEYIIFLIPFYGVKFSSVTQSIIGTVLVLKVYRSPKVLDAFLS